MSTSAPFADADSIDLLIARELPAARDGDQAAYGRIVSACQNMVTAIALAITRDVPASEDIAQDAFLSAWKHLANLHNPDSFLPWLRQITRNHAREHLRGRAHRPLMGVEAELAIAVAADPGPQPMQQLIDDEREHAASELISALPDESREALLLFYREGQSSRQVAQLLGITDAAARKRLSRARQSLRDDLLRRFGEFARDSAPSLAFTGTVTAALASLGNPASAATLAAAGTATAGGGLFGKSLFGKSLFALSGAGGVIAGSMVTGALAAHLTRKHVLIYAETLAERAALLRAYWLYLVVTMALMLFTFVVVWATPHFPSALGAILLTEGASLWTLLRIRNTLLPMIERDHRRDPAGAAERYRAYDYSYGPKAIVISGVFYVVTMALAHIAIHAVVQTPTGPSPALATAVKSVLDSAGRSALVNMALVGAIAGATIGGTLATFLTRKHLLVYAETAFERDALLREHRRYFAVTMVLILCTFAVVWWTPYVPVALGAILLTEGASLWTLLRIRRALLPMIERAARRDPAGAARRYRAYDGSYGPRAMAISGVLYVALMALLHLAIHAAAQTPVGLSLTLPGLLS